MTEMPAICSECHEAIKVGDKYIVYLIPGTSNGHSSYEVFHEQCYHDWLQEGDS
ncbi:MAG: hypothetical protein KGL39_14850 [Patescibacteria group bacterium]|nr:hypothetical protein [Patescibacteria group bacterium]